ncbi:hypothetical protein NBE98_02295 [Clostridium swellfunianum]|nr:hypothetical protein [Clostridium swellfunianum]
MKSTKDGASMSKIGSKDVQQFINDNLSEEFFKNNIPSQMSAFRILDITVSVNGMDEELYRQLPDAKKKQMEEENRVVENEEDINKLYNMLRKSLIPRTVAIIDRKLMEHKETVMPKLLEDLKRSANDLFIESAARILIKAEDNYSKEIANILPHIKYPYTQAVACYVLGKIGSEEHIELLYNYFNKFKRDYRNEEYFEGPLLGLHEMKRRFEF